MNADAEFVQFLKDKADEAHIKSKWTVQSYEIARCIARRDAFLEALKALGIAYEPQSH